MKMIILKRALLFVFAIFFLRENRVCSNYELFHYVESRDVTRRGKKGTIPWAPNHVGSLNDCIGSRKLPTISQVLSSITYNCFRKSSGSNIWAPNLRLPPGAI